MTEEPIAGLDRLTIPGFAGEPPSLTRTRAAWWGERLYHFDSLPSTNSLARACATAGEGDGTVFMAAVQTEGRGRLERAWHSPEGGLWLSLIIRPDLQADRLPGLTLLFSFWVLTFLEELLGSPLSLYWPNDIYREGKKLSGILVESALEGMNIKWLVLGAGINVNNSAHSMPEGIHATSLLDHLKKPLPLSDLATGLLEHLERRFREFEKKGFSWYLDALAGKCPMIGKGIEIIDHRGTWKAQCHDIGDQGQLIVESGGGKREELWSVERVSLP